MTNLMEKEERKPSPDEAGGSVVSSTMERNPFKAFPHVLTHADQNGKKAAEMAVRKEITFCGSCLDITTFNCRPDFQSYFDLNIAHAMTFNSFHGGGAGR